jgi:hypothetical protein
MGIATESLSSVSKNRICTSPITIITVPYYYMASRTEVPSPKGMAAATESLKILRQCSTLSQFSTGIIRLGLLSGSWAKGGVSTTERGA